MNVKRTPIKLDLGKDYTVYYSYSKKMSCRLIQPTEKGFNLLNLDSSKCILKHHLYPSKCSNHIKNKETWFWINSNLKIN